MQNQNGGSMDRITLMVIAGYALLAGEVAGAAERRPDEVALIDDKAFYIMNFSSIDRRGTTYLVPMMVEFKQPQTSDSNEVYASASILMAYRCEDRSHAVVSQRLYAGQSAQGRLVRAMEKKLEEVKWSVPRYGTIEARQVEAVCKEVSKEAK
jgi:hypothetical protein